MSNGISIAANSSKLNMLGTMLALRPTGTQQPMDTEQPRKNPQTPPYLMAAPTLPSERVPGPCLVPTPDPQPGFVYE